jgi:hypothetical protein
VILLVTGSARAQQCAEAIEEKSHQKTVVASTVAKAIASLERHEFEALVVDESLVQMDSSAEPALFGHAGTAVPIYVNLALHGAERVAAEVSVGLQRLARERAASMRAVGSEMRNQLGGEITAILLNAEMAMRETVSPGVTEKLSVVQEMAQRMRQRLEGKVVDKIVSAKVGKRKSTTDCSGLHG